VGPPARGVLHVPSERIKLVRDAVGTEFGGRHRQYELLHVGAPFAVKNYAFRDYGFEDPLADVDEFLTSYGAPADGELDNSPGSIS